jgi:3-deoxy-7-phosphoheptulonate synthase
MSSAWAPETWRARPAAQQPEWPEPEALDAALDELRRMPPLVFAGEARELTDALAAVAEGGGFLLHAGDCAESFDAFSANAIRDKLKVILQMAVVLTYSTGVPTVKVGRIAGQFAKPRSSPTELRDGSELPSFRGDMVNDFAFESTARRPDPTRLVRGYNQSAATLNLVRAFTKGGFADLSRVHAWNLEYAASSREGKRYEEMAQEIERALRFMAACGIDLDAELQLRQVDFYTSHEALLHTGEELDGAHVEFLSGVQNPLGVKLGPSVDPDDVVALCERLNPMRRPGRLTLVTRMGAQHVGDNLPPIMEAVRRAAHPVIWACDPMHGNTFVHANGYKTRHFDDVMGELRSFFSACEAADVWPGGSHTVS